MLNIGVVLNKIKHEFLQILCSIGTNIHLVSELIIMFCFVCLSLQEQFFGFLAAVANTGDRAAKLDLCLALMTFSSEGSFTYHTCCDTGLRFILSHLKDQQPRHTEVFKPPTYGSSDLYAAVLTTEPRRQLYHFLLT